MQQTLMGDPLSVLGMSLETNRCKPNQTYIWCLPFDYNQEKHPFTCELVVMVENRIGTNPRLFRWEFTMTITDHHLQNKSLPWDYDFRFVIEEISSINDKEQVKQDGMFVCSNRSKRILRELECDSDPEI